MEEDRLRFSLVLITLIIIGTHVELGAAKSARSTDKKPLLMFFLDGFRWDYFKLFGKGELPGFDKFRDRGVVAEHLEPPFPTLSYPSAYTLMTGLHPENHGMVENYMLDPIYNEEFRLGQNEDQFNAHWWDSGEPLWVTAEKQGKSAYMWFWFGCEVEIRKTRPTFCAPYLENINPSVANFSWAIDEALDKIEEGEADFAGIYFEQLDYYGHHDGAGSFRVKQAIRDVDQQLVRLHDELKSRRMKDDVNIMMFSDHGMTTQLTDNCVWLNNYFNSTDVFVVIPTGTLTFFWTWPGTEKQIYKKLVDANIPNTKVYLKNRLPKRYHLKDHYRVAPVVMITDPGYWVAYEGLTTCVYDGLHGYDNNWPEMNGIFMAKGPDFKRNYQRSFVKATWLYDVMCHVMGLDANPNDGNWDEIKDILRCANNKC